MTVHKDFKRLVRERAQRTGESYAAARRSLLAKSSSGEHAPPAEAQAQASAMHDVWFTRATKGYSGKPAKPTGFERHRITVTSAGALRVDAEVAFHNYGDHRYTIAAYEDACRSRFEYASPSIAIDARWEDGAWSGAVALGGGEGDGDGTHRFALPVATGGDATPVPSVVGRFLPLRLARDVGELGAYTPVPEDGFPAWRPLEPKSWFPAMGVSRTSLVVPRTVGGRGDETISLGGRRKAQAFRYDHVAADGRVLGTTWIGEHDAVLRYEQLGCVLVATSPDEARLLAPSPIQRDGRG